MDYRTHLYPFMVIWKMVDYCFNHMILKTISFPIITNDLDDLVPNLRNTMFFPGLLDSESEMTSKICHVWDDSPHLQHYFFISMGLFEHRLPIPPFQTIFSCPLFEKHILAHTHTSTIHLSMAELC